MALWKRKSKYQAHVYYPADFLVIGGKYYWSVYTKKGRLLATGKSRGLKKAVADANKEIDPGRITIRKIESG